MASTLTDTPLGEFLLLIGGPVTVVVGLLVALTAVCTPQPGGACAYGFDPAGACLIASGVALGVLGGVARRRRLHAARSARGPVAWSSKVRGSDGPVSGTGINPAPAGMG